MNRRLRRVGVFCGSHPGHSSRYLEGARALGEVLAERGLGIVYGGSNVGTMGALADAALQHGGEVIGVIPRALVEREIAHAGLSRLHVVASMHERKATMARFADAFIALPGGLGTLDELFEIATWAQLSLHAKPIGVLNFEGFFDHLLAHLDHAVAEGLLDKGHRALLLVEDDAARLLDRFVVALGDR